MSAIRGNPRRRQPAHDGATRTGHGDRATARRRLAPGERERQIVEGAVRFFSEHGFEGQLRDLARELGITHTLMYHYFPTKQALVERVCADLFAGRWDAGWERMLDDRRLDPATKLQRFYTEYALRILERDWVRVFVASGLSDRYITDRYFALLNDKLFPRLIRESRRYTGKALRGRPTPRESEWLIGLHGSIFYMGLRRWVYGLEPPHPEGSPFDPTFIADRVAGYLQMLPHIHGLTPGATA